MPPPRRWQFDSRRIYVRPRTDPQFAHLWWPASCRQPACYSLGRDRRTDGRIAVWLNAPLRRMGHPAIHYNYMLTRLTCNALPS